MEDRPPVKRGILLGEYFLELLLPARRVHDGVVITGQLLEYPLELERLDDIAHGVFDDIVHRGEPVLPRKEKGDDGADLRVQVAVAPLRVPHGPVDQTGDADPAAEQPHETGVL